MKKLIASVLAIAMVLSMFTMVFSANTEEKTNYSAIVDELQDLAEELVQVGPQLYKKYLVNDFGSNGNSNEYIATALKLSDDAYRSRYNIEWTTLDVYYEDKDDNKISYGVAAEKLFSDVDAFIAELEKSSAVLDVVALLGGYNSVAEAVADYQIVSDRNRVKLSTFTKEVQDTWPTSGSPKWEYEVDEDGNTKLDANGKPIFKLDDDGKKIPVMKTVSIFEDAPANIKAVLTSNYKNFSATDDYSVNQAATLVAEWMTENGYADLLPTGKVVKSDYSDAIEIVELVLLYADAAIRFGENADADYLAAELNAGRTVVYNTAIKAVKAVLKALEKQVTANGPYAEELAQYKNFEAATAAKYGAEVYNESYGINPYIVVFGDKYNYGLEAIFGVNVGYNWVTFEELAAHADCAELLTQLQTQLREAALFDVDGELYYYFSAKLAKLFKTFEDLCKAYIGKKTSSSTSLDTETLDTLLAIVDLWHLERIYTENIECNGADLPLYARTIETSAALYNLAGQIQFVRGLIETLGFTLEVVDGTAGEWEEIYWPYNPDGGNYAYANGAAWWCEEGENGNWYKFNVDLATLKGIKASSVRELIASVEASIKMLVPAHGQTLDASEVKEGLDLYKQAANILDYYADDVLAEYGAKVKPAGYYEYYDLLRALRVFENYLPATAGANAVAMNDVLFQTFQFKKADVGSLYPAGAFDDNGNYNFKSDYALEFAPVAFEYLTRMADLEEALDTFKDVVADLEFDAPNLGYADPEPLVEAAAKYDFLTWYDNIVVGDDGEYELYWYFLTGTDNTGCWLAYTGDDNVTSESGDNSDTFGTEVSFGEGSFLYTVMGDTESAPGYIFDYAVRNYAYFVTAFQAVREYLSAWWIDPSDGDYEDDVDEYFNHLVGGKFDYPEDGDKLDFSGDFSILDVIVSNGNSLRDKLIANLEAAAALLCVNNTKRIAMYEWVNAELVDLFDLDYIPGEATYLPGAAFEGVAADGKSFGNKENYVEGALEALTEAMTGLNKLIERYYHEYDEDYGWDFVVNRATPVALENAFEAVKEALYKLVTAKGAACLDVFFAQIETTLAKNIYGNEKDPDAVWTALENHVESINDYFPGESELRPYEYFAFTLRTLANNDATGNLYSNHRYDAISNKSYFAINFYDAFAAVVGDVTDIVTGQYPTAVREDAAKLAFFANDILDGINGGAFDQGDWNANNMPLWYALELSQYLAEYVAAASEQHATALAALKAEVLVPVIEAAEEIQPAFVSAAAARKLISAYEDACAVNANTKDAALYIYDAEQIQAAADALAAQVELAKAELGEAVYTVEDVLALIDTIVATAEARATGMAADFKALNIAAANAKTAIASGDYKQTSYVQNVVSAANKALEALANVKLEKADAYTPASYEAYEAAYNTLMDVVNVDTEVELTVAEALAAFKAAEEALVTIESATGAMYEAAKAAYEAALTVDETKYTAESYATFAAAVEALKAAIDSYAGDAELQAAIVNVKVAEVQLVAATVDEVGTLDD